MTIHKFAEAKRFLIALNPSGPWTLTSIDPAGGKRATDTLFCESIKQVDAFLAEHSGIHNIHLTVATTKPVSKKPRERDGSRFPCVQVDVDKDENNEPLTAATKQEVIERMRSREYCESVGMPGGATFITDSGNGAQAFWRIANGGLAASSENLQSIKEMNQFAITAFHGDSAARNPIQLMRLPGTVNLPNAAKLKAGRVKCDAKLVESNTREYAASSFRRESIIHVVTEEGESNIGPVEPTEDIAELQKWHVPDSIVRIVEHGRDSEWEGKVDDDTESGWQFRGVRGLLDCGVPDARVKGLITDGRWGIASSTLKERSRGVEGYADRQIRRAHEFNIEERMSRFPDDGIEEQYDKPMEETPKNDDIFAPLFEVTAGTRGKLYNAKGEPRLLAQLKVKDRPRYEKLLAKYREDRIPDLTGLGREVDKFIKAVERKQEAKKSWTAKAGEEDFLRDKKTGVVKVTQANIRLAIEKLGVTLRHNSFSSMPSIDGLSADFNGPLQDFAIHEMWLRIDDAFGFRPRLDYFTTIVTNVCRRNTFHPVREYLDGLTWDGVPRIDTWLIDHCHAEDTPFNRAVGRIWLIAAVRRIMKPGEKFDTMLILEGPEGNNKSGLFRVLAILDEWFSDSIRFTDDDKQIMEKASGKWIIEIADLHGMTKAGYDKIKAQLSRQSDRARLAYARFASEVLRQFVSSGTSNVYEYLASLTGNRRIWCVRTNGWIDLDAVRAVVHQLWAEAVVLEASEPDLFLPRELWEAARIVQAEREVENAFTDKLDMLFGTEDGWVFPYQIWEALDIQLARVGDKEQQQLGHAMKALGFKKKRRTWNKVRVPYYERGLTERVVRHFRFDFNQGQKRWVLESEYRANDDELEEDEDADLG
jgi:hypothetical protein